MIKAEQMKIAAKEEKTKFMNEIKEFKRETVKHQRRLEKRKAEELERGAHEYANYLVSMLNSGFYEFFYSPFMLGKELLLQHSELELRKEFNIIFFWFFDSSCM